MGSAIEAVTHSADIDQEPWLARLGLDLLSQIGDVGIHNAVGNEGLSPPNLVQQLFSAQCLAASEPFSSFC